MAEPSTDWSWSERTLFMCTCGLGFPVERWRWIDREARPELAAKAVSVGPHEGECPSCGNAAEAQSPWLELSPGLERAHLVLSPDARGDTVRVLAEHLQQLERRDQQVPAWLLQPTLRFVEARTRAGVVEAVTPSESTGVPTAVGSTRESTPSGSESLGHVGKLSIEDGVVRVSAVLSPNVRRLWGTAAVRGRPVHLRTYGYPLVGVRLIASHLGQMSVLDGLVDIAEDLAGDAFVALSTEFRLELELHSRGSSSSVKREVSAGGLERNAALCIESARAELATGEYPPDAFPKAVRALGKTAPKDRVSPAEHSIAEGDYRFLISPRETAGALAHLEAVSQKANLAQLLEVDGFSVEEYEAIRKRVLQASVEHGICAPRKFWRRIVASGFAEDAGDYVERLSHNRAALIEDGGDDLDPEVALQVWEDIHALCRRKGIAPPDALREALGLEEEDTPVRPRGNPGMSAAGEIGSAAGEIGESSRAAPDLDVDRLRQRLLQPEQRVDAANEALDGQRALDDVLAALEHFGAEEFLGVLPALATVGPAAIPGLTNLLRSPRGELRQAAAILLGRTGEESCLPALCECLLTETEPLWVEVARAIGAFGPRALPHLCSGGRAGTTLTEEELMGRLARAMAEVALVGKNRNAVAQLESSQDRAVAFSATHALATLEAVRTESLHERLSSDTAGSESTHSFARRVYDLVGWPALVGAEESGAAVLGEGDLEFI